VIVLKHWTNTSAIKLFTIVASIFVMFVLNKKHLQEARRSVCMNQTPRSSFEILKHVKIPSHFFLLVFLKVFCCKIIYIIQLDVDYIINFIYL